MHKLKTGHASLSTWANHMDRSRSLWGLPSLLCPLSPLHFIHPPTHKHPWYIMAFCLHTSICGSRTNCTLQCYPIHPTGVVHQKEVMEKERQETDNFYDYLQRSGYSVAVLSWVFVGWVFGEKFIELWWWLWQHSGYRTDSISWLFVCQDLLSAQVIAAINHNCILIEVCVCVCDIVWCTAFNCQLLCVFKFVLKLTCTRFMCHVIIIIFRL